MRIAQGCAILIAVVNSVDIMVAMNNLLRVPTAIIVIDNNGDDESQGLINTHGPSIHNATELSSIQHGIGHARSNISGTIQTKYLFEERNCVGPEVMSFETKSLDLMQLSSSAAFHVGNKGNNRFNTTMALPAIIQCNECGRQEDGSSIFSDIVTCGISGGVCSEPQEEFGFGRQCICPQGQYGALCDEYYGTSCKFLEIIPLEDIEEEPLGAQTFYDFSYTLKEDERGFGNTPVWMNEVEGYIDRIERREGLHWTITRQVTNGTDFYTIALADAVSEMDGGAATSGLTSNPQPAGLTFYAPKTTAWGTQPDYSRPFSSYQVQCKSAM